MVKILIAVGDGKPPMEDINQQFAALGPGWGIKRAFTISERVEPKRHMPYCRAYQHYTTTVVAEGPEEPKE